jgi:hypothetical protein
MSFKRVDIVPSHHSFVVSIVAADKTSFAAFGSSKTMMLPPSPVTFASTAVISRSPFAVLAKRPLVF